MRIVATSIIVGAVCSFSFQANSQSSEAIDNQRKVAECTSLDPSLTKAYCECVVLTSGKITDNDPILDLTLRTVKNSKSEAKIIYDNMIESPIYSEHNFATAKEKREYVQGRIRLFADRLKRSCHL
ncbi:hypothetical protein C7I85_22695 [Mesorhizobium soli]|uniref:Uncharacterized protein n=1 Tax=Pseudaminobacter soli (ex Li et al. 2025) TaxID=1295366 RepID=A0A2P7S4I1_9HYPH|nr:hypothetical protein C7I85_22695 [Mesorhizobium soli]